MRAFQPALTMSLVLALPTAGAFASGAGLGVPENGGQSGGAAELGAAGIPNNPATVGSGAPGEALFDLGSMFMSPTWQREQNPVTGENYDEVGYFNVAPVPFLSVVSRPKDGPVGVGLALHVPYGRGAAYPSEGAGRYHSISADLKSIWLTPAASMRVAPWLTLGASASYVHTRLSMLQRMDMGSVIYGMDPSAEPLPPAEDPFLEGEMDVKQAVGHSYGWGLGAVITPNPDLWFGIGFQSPVRVEAHGNSELTPSLDLALKAYNAFEADFNLPASVNFGFRYKPQQQLTLGSELSWIGWSTFDAFYITLSESELRGTNGDADAAMSALGISSVEALNQRTVRARELQDTFSVRALAAYEFQNPWTLKGTLGYDNHAVPDATVNPGNLDFDSVVVGAGAEYAFSQAWSVYGTVSQYFAIPRHVTQSALDPYADPETGRGAPSGNGDYNLFLNRTAIGVRRLF